MLFIANSTKRVTTSCPCGRQTSPVAGWRVFQDGKPLCRWCARSHPDETALVRKLNQLLPVDRFGDVAFVIDGTFENAVCRIATGGGEVDCFEKLAPRRIEMSLTIPIGAVKPRTRCRRHISLEYPAIDAVLREINGQPPAEPEPAPASPPEKSADQLRAEQRERWRIEIACALAGCDINRMKIGPGLAAERVLAVVDEMINASMEGKRGV